MKFWHHLVMESVTIGLIGWALAQIYALNAKVASLESSVSIVLNLLTNK